MSSLRERIEGRLKQWRIYVFEKESNGEFAERTKQHIAEIEADLAAALVAEGQESGLDLNTDALVADAKAHPPITDAQGELSAILISMRTVFSFATRLDGIGGNRIAPSVLTVWIKRLEALRAAAPSLHKEGLLEVRTRLDEARWWVNSTRKLDMGLTDDEKHRLAELEEKERNLR